MIIQEDLQKVQELGNDFNEELLELIRKFMQTSELSQILLESTIRSVLLKTSAEITISHTEVEHMDKVKKALVTAMGMHFDLSYKAYLTDIRAVSN